MTKKKKTVEPLTDLPDKKDEHFAFCKRCNGKGIDIDEPTQYCPDCGGSGMVKA